jgi:hypothetical protein
MRRNASLLVGLTLTLVVLSAPSAGASPHSFSGSCAVQGTVAFDPPVTLSEQQLDVVYGARGTCSGTLDGRSVAGAPVALDHAGTSIGSCLEASTTQPGGGAITFDDGPVLPYSFDFRAIGTEVLFTFSGSRSGDAVGRGTFLTSRTPLDAGPACAGAGDATLPMDLELQTTSPLVSGKTNAKKH